MCLYRICFENDGGKVFAESEFEAASDCEAVTATRHVAASPRLARAYTV